MKKKYSIYLLVLLVIILSCQSEAVKVTGDSANRVAIIDSTITAFQKKLVTQQIDSVFAKSKFNGSISVLQNGEKIYEKFSGFEDFKNKKALDSNSVFAIGSLSKQFTAVLILLQEGHGKLNTEDKVSKYLPEFQNKVYENVTIHQLLNHTSGISDMGSGLHSKSDRDFNYSNKGYRFLGEIIEKVSGKSYDENAKDLFFKARMVHTTTANLFTGEHLAGAYTGTSSNFQPIGNMPKRLADKSISVAAGGILSSVSDLHRWNDALYNGKVLKAESLKKMLKKSSGTQHPILGEVGYGYGIMISKGKMVSYFHSGYVKGSPSLNIYYPETKTSVVILSNIANEAKGKNAVFIPHREVKSITDVAISVVGELKKDWGVE